MTATAAHADPVAQNPLVICTEANNELGVNLASGNATVASTLYHGCVSVDVPSIVLSVVQPRPGTATGTPAATSINFPRWTISWCDATNTKVAETTNDLTFTYNGPLPNLMASIVLAGLDQVIAGTGTRVCPTTDTCTYYKTAVAFAAAPA